MRVLHVIPSIAKVRGGPSQAILEMVKALHLNDVDAEIATTNDNGSGLLDVPLEHRIDYQDVPVRFFSRFSPPINSIAEFVFSAQLTNWLWQNISSYDLVHIHGVFSYPATIAMLIARFRNVPFIVRPAGLLCQWSLKQANIKKQIYLKIVERSNLNHSKALHLTSDQEQKELVDLGLKTNSFIIPHGLSIPALIPDAYKELRTKFRLPQDEPIILFLSRIHEKKGLDYLIPALSKLVDQRFTFILAGNGDPSYETEIDRLLQHHNIYSRTIKTGFVQGRYKNLLLQGSDIFALTSYSENFGVVVLEALAAATPALITSEVALSSLLKKEQIGYVTELDIDKIKSSLNHILSNLPEAKDRGCRARKFIKENYAWDQIAIQITNIYSKILEKNHINNIT